MIHQHRIGRAQEAMREHGIDAYLILTHDDYIYFFGEDRFQPRGIIPASGQPIIVCFSGEEPELKESLQVEDVRVFGSVGQQIKDVVTVMHEVTGAKEKIKVGVQMGFFTPAFLLNMFQRANPQVEVTDIAPVMDPIRVVKDQNEIDLLKRACNIAEIGMEAARRTLKPGITENEVGAEIEYAMRKAGGQGTATPVFVNSGHRSGWLHGTASEKVIESGDLVVIDLVPRFRGYCANLCRTFVIGTPSDSQTKMHETYVAAQAAAVAAIDPGVKMKSVDEAAKAVFDRNGFGQYYVYGISHSIGLMFEETPMPTIHPAHINFELVAGMVLTAGHSVLSVPGQGGVRVEDMYHLSASGAEPLTNFSRELIMV
jgi:Xaa-Pro dipeptidase